MFVPDRLKVGDEIRVISPADSGSFLSYERKQAAIAALHSLGLKVSFGTYSFENGDHGVVDLEMRLQDFHQAIEDPSTKAIISTIGGHNSIELCARIDWNLVKKHPKIICGFSDITALLYAVSSKAQIETYYGPHFSTFSQQRGLEYTLRSFKEHFFDGSNKTFFPSSEWSDDPWWNDQINRNFVLNDGPIAIQPGACEGICYPGSMLSLSLLASTGYIFKSSRSVLLVESDDAFGSRTLSVFSRLLEYLSFSKSFGAIQAVGIGRFPVKCGISLSALASVIKTKRFLRNKPVIANLDFGHTDPKAVIPIGRAIRIDASSTICDVHFL